MALEGCTDGALFPRGPRAGAQRLAPLNLLSLPASLLTIAFTGQRLLNAQFLARLQIKRMPFDFHDYVFLQDLPLEALERVLKRLALLEPYLSQIAPPSLTRIPIRIRAGTFSINCCFVILSKSTCFRIPNPGSRGLLFPNRSPSFSGCVGASRTQRGRLRLGTALLFIIGRAAGRCGGWPTPTLQAVSQGSCRAARAVLRVAKRYVRLDS